MQIVQLDQYRGKLTPQQIADGMNAAERNAARLLQDAELLFCEQRYPSATALAILAIEEAGKNTILRQLSTASDDAGIKKAWKAYRSHKEKNFASIVPQLVEQGAKEINDFKPMVASASTHRDEVDILKQVALYTDCVGDAEWCQPTDAVDKAVAVKLLAAARTLARERGENRHTAREVELWIEHMGPVIDKSLSDMKVALKAWFEAMRAENLTDADPDSVNSFIGEGG